MKHFFSTLKNVSIEGLDNEFIEIIPGVNLTKDIKTINRILTPEICAIIGGIETNVIMNSNAFVYYEYEDHEDDFQNHSNLQILEFVLIWIDDVLKNSWLLKDNAMVIDSAYLIDNSIVDVEAATLRLQYQFTQANGTYNEIELNKSELMELIKLHHEIESYLHGKNSGSTSFMLEKNFSRIGRSLQFIKQAREARNLAYKTSNYCSALETIFSTDNAELSHKLSERVAFFLSPKFDKLKTFKIIKKAYAIRSKLTHGDYLEQKQIENLGELSVEIDILLREAFLKIFYDKTLLALFDSDKSKIDVYFESLIFQ